MSHHTYTLSNVQLNLIYLALQAFNILIVKNPKILSPRFFIEEYTRLSSLFVQWNPRTSYSYLART